jgi:hypothetical protein
MGLSQKPSSALEITCNAQSEWLWLFEKRYSTTVHNDSLSI